MRLLEVIFDGRLDEDCSPNLRPKPTPTPTAPTATTTTSRTTMQNNINGFLFFLKRGLLQRDHKQWLVTSHLTYRQTINT